MSRKSPRELKKDEWGNVILIDFAEDNSALGFRGNWAQSTTYRCDIRRSLALAKSKPTVMFMTVETAMIIAQSQEIIEQMRGNPTDIDWIWFSKVKFPKKIYGIPVKVLTGPEKRVAIEVDGEFFILNNVC